MTRGRPCDREKLTAILQAARDLFARKGVDHVTMDEVAAQAKVSKRTIYNRFAMKEDLLYAVIKAVMNEVIVPLPTQLPADAFELRVVLLDYGCRLVDFWTNPVTQDLERLVIAEAKRHPLMALRYWSWSTESILSNLAGLLSHAQEEGWLQLEDPPAAAEDLIGLWQGPSLQKDMLGITQASGHADRQARIHHGLDVLLLVWQHQPFADDEDWLTDDPDANPTNQAEPGSGFFQEG